MSFRVRVRSVKFKAGGELRVFNNQGPSDTSRGLEKAAQHIAGYNDLAGFALVAWALDGKTMTSVRVGDGGVVPRLMVPEFVRNAIVEEIWA